MLKTVLFFVLTLEILLVPGNSFADDDFSSELIDGSKWRYQEYARYVDEEQGVLRTTARTDSQGEESRSYLRFSNPESVTGVKTEVVLRACSVTRNDDNALAKVRVYGVFYNTQTAPSGRGGDVGAEVSIGDRGYGLEAYWKVGEVADDEGSGWNDLEAGTLVAPGTLSLNTTYILELVYDEVGRQLRFAIQDSTGTTIASDIYAADNRQSPAYAPDKLIWAAAYDDSAFVDAEFDNVHTKADTGDDFSLYDPFDHYDAEKWDSHQKCRLIEEGQLIAMVQSLGESQYTISTLQDNPDYIRAEVTVSSENEILPGDHGSASIDGFFYNDSVPVDHQTGWRGNVFASIAIEDQAGDLGARCNLVRILDDEANQEDTIWEQQFDDIAIQYDTGYTLSLEYTHTTLIFTLSDGVNAQTHTYTIPETNLIYPPNDEYRSLRTRICGCGSKVGGVMKAAFDNVVTTPETDSGNGGGGGGGCFLQTSCPLKP
jgi:hypothetical protein